jgi:putative FmdB family regulatory protein
MPIYEFKCADCDHVFEVMGSYAEREKDHTCPECGSKNVKQAISLFSAKPPSSW